MILFDHDLCSILEVIPSETIERRVTRNSLREESDPEPERRITRNSKRDETSTNMSAKSPSSIRTSKSAPPRPEKRVQIEPIRKTIPIEDLWTEDEIQIARQELNKVNDKVISPFLVNGVAKEPLNFR